MFSPISPAKRECKLQVSMNFTWTIALPGQNRKIESRSRSFSRFPDIVPGDKDRNIPVLLKADGFAVGPSLVITDTRNHALPLGYHRAHWIYVTLRIFLQITMFAVHKTRIWKTLKRNHMQHHIIIPVYRISACRHFHKSLCQANFSSALSAAKSGV